MGFRDTLRGIVDKLKGKKPPLPKPPRVLGHRGIAIGNTVPGKGDLSLANIAKWHTLSGDEVEAFVHGGELLFVHSTNVSAMQYFPEESKMMCEFKDGSAYLYSNVTESEAYALAQAQSKGGAIWDYFRIRGTKYGHKKPYVKLR